MCAFVESATLLTRLVTVGSEGSFDGVRRWKIRRCERWQCSQLIDERLIGDFLDLLKEIRIAGERLYAFERRRVTGEFTEMFECLLWIGIDAHGNFRWTGYGDESLT